MIRLLRVIVWVSDILRCLVMMFTPSWFDAVRQRSERYWYIREQGARVRWAYAEQYERFDRIHDFGYTAGLMP